MNLTPADLGTGFENTLINRRREIRTMSPTEKVGMISTAVIGSGTLIAGTVSQAGIVAAVGGVMIALGAGFLHNDWRGRRQLTTAPVTDDEIEFIRPASQRAFEIPAPVAFLANLIGRPLPMPKVSDGLEEAFFKLAQQLRELEVSEESTANELRRTLKALGDAVSDLPAPAELPDIDVVDLVADAEALLMRAKREKDEVIASSLQRQAEATVRRARATADAMKLARRTRTLRQEVLAQIEGCRAALPALARTSGAASSLGIGRFSALAEQVQGVAREAASVAAAQEELAQAVGTYTTTAPEQQTLRLGG